MTITRGERVSDSNKWSISRVGPDVDINFYDPSGVNVVARARFDEPAIREFYEALRQVMSSDPTWTRPAPTVEVVALTRSWPCRFLRHAACQTAYASPRRAVVYPESPGRFPAVGWLRCPCPCHGDLPTCGCETEGAA